MQYSDEYVLAPWGKICVVRTGRSGKPLVLTHGQSDNAGGLQSLVDLIDPVFNVYIIELPGCGFSDQYPPGLPLHVEIFVEVLRRVVDHYDLKEFFFIGHSMGAQIGLLFNGVYPGRITRFVALDSILLPAVTAESYGHWYRDNCESFFKDDAYRKKNALIHTRPAYTFQDALSTLAKARGISEDAAKPIAVRNLTPVQHDIKFRFTWDPRCKQIGLTTFSEEFQLKYFGSIKIPYLLILADQTIDKRLQLTHRPLLKVFYENNPLFRMKIVSGNHDAHLNTPDVVADAVSVFLSKNDVSTIPRLETEECYERIMSKRDVKSKL